MYWKKRNLYFLKKLFGLQNTEKNYQITPVEPIGFWWRFAIQFIGLEEGFTFFNSAVEQWREDKLPLRIWRPSPSFIFTYILRKKIFEKLITQVQILYVGAKHKFFQEHAQVKCIN